MCLVCVVAISITNLLGIDSDSYGPLPGQHSLPDLQRAPWDTTQFWDSGYQTQDQLLVSACSTNKTTIKLFFLPRSYINFISPDSHLQAQRTAQIHSQNCTNLGATFACGAQVFFSKKKVICVYICIFDLNQPLGHICTKMLKILDINDIEILLLCFPGGKTNPLIDQKISGILFSLFFDYLPNCPHIDH